MMLPVSWFQTLQTIGQRRIGVSVCTPNSWSHGADEIVDDGNRVPLARQIQRVAQPQ